MTERRWNEAATARRTARDTLRKLRGALEVQLAALDTKEATRKLSSGYREERRTALRSEYAEKARPWLDVVRDTAAEADAAREYGKADFFRTARFAPALRDEAVLVPAPGTLTLRMRDEKASEANTAFNVAAEMLEHTARLRWREELKTYSGRELAQLAAASAAGGTERDAALLAMIEREGATRPNAAERVAVKVALDAARENFPLPAERVEALAAAEELDTLAKEAVAAAESIRTGKPDHTETDATIAEAVAAGRSAYEAVAERTKAQLSPAAKAARKAAVERAASRMLAEAEAEALAEPAEPVAVANAS